MFDIALILKVLFKIKNYLSRLNMQEICQQYIFR